jgi:hypothetical protein
MSKNAIHNFNLSIKNSADLKSSEHLTNIIIKELAKVSKEMSQQKDILQIWQEQKHQNATAVTNNSSSLTEGGAIAPIAETIKKTATSISNTPSGSEETIPNFNISTGITSSSALIGGGVADNTGRTTMSSPASANITPSALRVEDNTLNFSKGITTQTYESVAAQQTLAIPQMLQTNSSEPTTEVVRAEIKKKLEAAILAKDTSTIAYWTGISKAFEEGATAKDYDGKPNDVLFTQMYTMLKQANSGQIESQIFNWEIVRKKMIESIDNNILKAEVSSNHKIRWELIKKQLNNDTINVANLFERYDELFLLLREVEGLDNLPANIIIITKTKIYPNLSADKVYPEIGKEAIYGRLKQVSETSLDGSGVNKGAIKIKNTKQTSFIVGESLNFFVDEAFINQKKNPKENINWIVYNTDTKKENVFKNEGTSFSYNFDMPGKYRIDAYGKNHTIKQKKNLDTATFIELKIVAQQILITPPANAKAEFIRSFTEEKTFKVSLKNTAVKTLNPLKLYYQVETIMANKVTQISEEQELDSTGIIKLAMPDLGKYKIKVTSKDQYALTQEFKTSVIKNEVTSIGLAEKASNDNVFLLGDPNKTVTFEVKNFKINPATDDEKEEVRWIVYDSNNKPYLPLGDTLFTEKNNPQKKYLLEWSSFKMHIPQKEGNYTVEAYSDSKKRTNSGCIYKIEVKQPEITEAHWAWSGGSKKVTSGFSEESNYIQAQIPHYENQTVRIYFYLNNAKTNYYIDVKTNEKGKIFEEVKFDAFFQNEIGFKNRQNAKIGFKLLGIQNSKPYPFKASANYESDTVLSVTTDKKILDVYFMYDGKRITSQDQVPFDKKGTAVTIVAKTQNMVGKEIVLTAHKVGEKPVFRHRVIVNSEGVATVVFIITPTKGAKNGTVNKYYVGIEDYSTKHLTDKMINMVVGTKRKNTAKLNSDALEMIWGGKVSVEFRQKVLQICEELWGKDQKYEMANALMIAMSVETGETFSSSLIRLTKNGYVGASKEEHKNNPSLVHNNPIGLAQFTEDAVKSLILKEKGILENKETAKAITKKQVDDYKQKLALLSPEDQLSYVRDYLKLFNIHKKVVRPEDVYMIIFAPIATGKGDNINIYKKFLTDEDKRKEKVNPNYENNDTMDTRNDGFNKGNNDSIIQSGELLSRYRKMKVKGMRYAIDTNEARKLNQVLAEKIIKEGRVTFANSHVSGIIDKAMAQDNITDTSLGQNAKRSNYKRAPGGEIEVLSELLYIMYQLSKDYTFNVSEISGADHSVNSKHYFGKAFDINEIDGKDIGYGIGAKAVCLIPDSLILEVQKKALSHGASRVLNSLNDVKKREHHNHFHIEVTP